MCRKYLIEHQYCYHTRQEVFNCPNCPQGQPRKYTFETITSSEPIECPECFVIWASQPKDFQRYAPTSLSNSKRAHAMALWDNIHTTQELYAKETFTGTHPFAIDRITASDRQWFEAQVCILESSVLDLSEGRTDVKDILTITSILHLLASNRICAAHDAFLSRHAAKPAFLTSVPVADIDIDRAECPICYENFTVEMEPVSFPCSKLYIYCRADALGVLKADGPKCSLCRKAFDANMYFMGEVEETFMREEDVVSPLWMRKLREGIK